MNMAELLVELLTQAREFIGVAKIGGIDDFIELGRERAIDELFALVVTVFGRAPGLPRCVGIFLARTLFHVAIAVLERHIHFFALGAGLFVLTFAIHGAGFAVALAFAGALAIGVFLILTRAVVGFGIGCHFIIGEAEVGNHFPDDVLKRDLVFQAVAQFRQGRTDLDSTKGRHTSTIWRADGGGGAPVSASRARSATASETGA